MTLPARSDVWHRVRRTLLPTYGARANASDGLADARRSRDDRLQAALAVEAARAPTLDPPRVRQAR